MKHDKIKYIIKTDCDSDVFQSIIDRVNSGEFENAETNDYGKIKNGILENGRRISGTVVYRDLTIAKFVDANEFVTCTNVNNSSTTHCINAWNHVYIQMEDGLIFIDYGAKADFSEIDKADIINYCKDDIIPEWANSDYIELDDIVL